MEAGGVCAVTGLTTTVPGQGLGAQQESSVPVLEPVLNYRIYLPDEVNAVEMMGKLKQLEEEDPQLHILWNEQLQEIHAQMMGQVQIEVLTQLIKERFGVVVVFGHKPTVPIHHPDRFSTFHSSHGIKTQCALYHHQLYHSFNANALNFKQNAKDPGIFLSRDLKILTM